MVPRQVFLIFMILSGFEGGQGMSEKRFEPVDFLQNASGSQELSDVVGEITTSVRLKTAWGIIFQSVARQV